ncbi:hypothetical protein ACVII1_000206 [Bradyrhizobium elkanii]|uniref:Integrase catalytic domain-containing protein n=1 Tax=Bradyrhizobium elkanii TaxID=29448 RepID=A0ABV4ERE3_BRAEL
MGLSERRACLIVGADRKAVRYRSRRPPDTELRRRLRELANERRRFGYRRLFILLRREGEPSGINRIHRLYREEGLAVRKRRARRKAVGVRVPILLEARPNARWSLDFVYDQFANGRRFRVLNIVDDVTKECLGAIPDTSISGRRVARELTTIVARRGKPGSIVSDNGTEFTCNAMLAWCKETGIDWHFIAPRQTDPECLCGERQRPHARRILERDAVLRPRRCAVEGRRMDRRLQCEATALLAEIPDPRGLRRHIHRNGRSAAQPRPAPPIARCTTRATRRTKPRDSNRRWMKVRWQVTCSHPQPIGDHMRHHRPIPLTTATRFRQVDRLHSPQSLITHRPSAPCPVSYSSVRCQLSDPHDHRSNQLFSR